jgi:DNA repair protein RecO (recombination protein O)
MKTVNTEAVILGHKNLGEKDKIKFLYTKEFGKLRAIAKGSRSIKSKFTGHLETLNFCKASLYFGPKNIIITEVSTKKTYLKKRNCLNTITKALEIAEFTNSLLYENQKLEALNEILEESLKFITTKTKKDLIKKAYIIKLLDKSGNIPDFKNIKSNIEEKYLKFLNYLKKESLTNIEKIKLTKKEEEKIEILIQKIISSSA